jgi:hypothetical protein
VKRVCPAVAVVLIDFDAIFPVKDTGFPIIIVGLLFLYLC